MIDLFPCPAPPGAETLLADECRRVLGAKTRLLVARGGVTVEGDERAAMALNLESRLAQRVLWPLAHGAYRHEQDLYDIARGVRWPDWITPQQTLRVDTTAQRSPLRSLNFATLRIKDAVCDALREASGERPSVDTRAPDLPLALHLTPDARDAVCRHLGRAAVQARLARCACGRARRDRRSAAEGNPGRRDAGRRRLARPRRRPRRCSTPAAAPAPSPSKPRKSPAASRPASSAASPSSAWRRGASSWARWRELREAARARIHARAVPIFAGDVSFRMTDFATRNAERAGVARAIEFKTADALQRLPPAERGRAGAEPALWRAHRRQGHGARPAQACRGAREDFEGGGTPASFFAELAAHWKRNYAGWTAWVLSPEMKLPSLMRLKESQRVPMWNGPIECRLFRFDMVAGSARR